MSVYDSTHVIRSRAQPRKLRTPEPEHRGEIKNNMCHPERSEGPMYSPASAKRHRSLRFRMTTEEDQDRQEQRVGGEERRNKLLGRFRVAGRDS
jgi:hypothetical protein